MLNMALPKGRLGDKVFSMLERAGYGGARLAENSRCLVVEDEVSEVRYFLVKPSDVAIYVLHGAADVGVVGKDSLLETTPDVYELLDLNIGICRMVVAGREGFTPSRRVLRVATKYPNIAKNYYDAQNKEIELIALNGSIELAPIVGLSDVIVDIVETGSTLQANQLVVLEEIMPISARLISNIASYKFKNAAIQQLKKALAREVTV